MSMRIIIDAMGGDNAPMSTVQGACLAALEYPEASIVLTGDSAKINEAAHSAGVSLDKITVIHTDCSIAMTDEPTCVIREKKNSSMSIGLKMLKDGEGDAFISAGNTGALHVGASLIVRCPKGICRACIATVLPFASPVLLLDCGANVTVQSEYLMQWALIGSIYTKKVLGVEKPRVGLLNNGTEECKGTPVELEAYKLLSGLEGITFAGNVEARDVPFGVCDVLVTDGFTGNIMLKYTEGLGSMFADALKKMFYHNTVTKLAGAVMKKQLGGLKSAFDSSAHGGAPIIGLNKPVFKAHGSSDAVAIKNAVRQAVMYIKNDTENAILSAAQYLQGVKAPGENMQ